MTAFDWAAAITGGLLLWAGIGIAVGSLFGKVIRRADKVQRTYPPILPPIEWTEQDDQAFRWFAAGDAR